MLNEIIVFCLTRQVVIVKELHQRTSENLSHRLALKIEALSCSIATDIK